MQVFTLTRSHSRYLAGFLSVRENFAPAHKLLGQIYEGLQEVEKAITAYKRSLDLDDKQKDVLIKSKSSNT